MNQTTHPYTSRIYRILAGLSLAVPVGVLWGWNLVMPDIFGASPLEFRNAFGLVLLGLIASIPFYARRNRHREPGLD